MNFGRLHAHEMAWRAGGAPQTRDLPAALVREHDSFQVFKLPRRLPADYGFAQRTVVVFSDFERVAIQDVRRSITKRERAAFEAWRGFGDEFWRTQSSSVPPVAFVHTDAQAEALNQSELPARWADVYLDIAQKHNEFGYLKREEFFIAVDSTENFDASYSGNWYYYFK